MARRTNPAPSRPWTPSAGVGSPPSSSRTSCRQKSEKIALAEVDFTAGGLATQSRFKGTARNPDATVTQTTPSSFRLPGGLVERPGVGDDVVQVGAGRAPAELAAGLVAGGDAGGGVARAARRELDRDGAPGDLADHLDDLLVA